MSDIAYLNFEKPFTIADCGNCGLAFTVLYVSATDPNLLNRGRLATHSFPKFCPACGQPIERKREMSDDALATWEKG